MNSNLGLQDCYEQKVYARWEDRGRFELDFLAGLESLRSQKTDLVTKKQCSQNKKGSKKHQDASSAPNSMISASLTSTAFDCLKAQPTKPLFTITA
jgi:hypothetical protein